MALLFIKTRKAIAFLHKNWHAYPTMQVKRKIIHVVNVRWFNATAWYAPFLARLMKEAGHDVLVLALAGTESFAKSVEFGLTTVALDLNAKTPFGMLGLQQKLRHILADFQPDVVNCHRGENFFLWAKLRREFPFALVRTRGDQRPPKSNIINKWLHCHLCDALISTSSATTFDLTHILGCPESHVSTLLGGVDTTVFIYSQAGREQIRAEFAIPDNVGVLGFVGRFDPVKGIQELIQAVGNAQKSGLLNNVNGWYDFRLLLVGFSAGISLETIQAWLHEAGIAEKTIITGKRPDVPALMSAMDAGVIASQGSETIARVAFEMMSCGLPVFSTRVGVLPDLIPDWATVPAGDENALTNMIIQILGSTALRHKLKEHCLRCVNGFSETDFLRQTLTIYEKALKHKNK